MKFGLDSELESRRRQKKTALILIRHRLLLLVPVFPLDSLSKQNNNRIAPIQKNNTFLASIHIHSLSLHYTPLLRTFNSPLFLLPKTKKQTNKKSNKNKINGNFLNIFITHTITLSHTLIV